MKITVDISPETDFSSDALPVPEGRNEAATQFLEWLHEAASLVDAPPWLGTFNDAEDDQPWGRPRKEQG